MNNNESDLFRRDPWDGILVGSYPRTARALYSEDDRFMVSIDNDGRRVLIVFENGMTDMDVPQEVSGIEFKFLSDNGPARLECVLADLDLAEQFSIVAKDLAFKSKGLSGRALYEVFFENVHAWGEFLKPSRKGLGWRKLLGLVGELYTLDNLITTLDGKRAVSAWNGPDNKKQDFGFGEQAIEVKSSAAGDSNVVSISSLEQLQQTVPNIYLYFLRFDESLSGAHEISLAKLIESITNKISNDFVCYRDFLQKSRSLVGKASSSELTKELVLIEEVVYLVDDKFPRLTPDLINNAGIVSANYKIDLNSAIANRLTLALPEVIENV